MSLDYSSIFKVFVDLCTTAVPIAIFLYLLDILLNFFFSFAFPKRFRKGEQLMNEETNVAVNEIIVKDEPSTIYEVALNINTILSVLTFTIIIIFLYRYIKCCFRKKQGELYEE